MIDKPGLYLSKGGYVVEIKYDTTGTPETSPGVNRVGILAKDCIRKSWAWHEDGSISGLSPEWNEKLTLIGKLLSYEIPDPPKGYRHKDGFPQFREPQLGEYYFCNKTLFLRGEELFPTFTAKAFIAEKIKETETVTINKNTVTWERYDSKKEEKMKKETAIKVAKFTGNLAYRMVNYWIFEPAWNTITRVGNSVRYVTMFATIATGVYAYYNPQATKDFAKSLLPKISVEKPEIFK